MADQEQSERDKLIERLTAYVAPGAANVAVPDAEFIGECVDQALALVGQACRDAGGQLADVPDEIRSRAAIEAGSELFHRRAAPNGISQFAAPDGGQLRIARDPMNVARVILAPFLPLGFA